MQRKYLYSSIAVGLSLATLATWAAAPPSFTIPFSFTAHTAAKASEVNANFTALENQILYLKDQVNTLSAKVQSHSQLINENSLHVVALEDSKVFALEPYLNLLDVPDPVDPSITYPTVQLSGINLQLVNGGSLSNTTNGLGNLIIGYSESNPNFEDAFCSQGQYEDQSSCEINGYTWAKGQRSGSHNLVLGINNAYTKYGSVLTGGSNIANGHFASFIGGQGNTLSGRYASITGGRDNTASADFASIGGGKGNTASADTSTVSGGINNVAGDEYASVSGGDNNHALGKYASISGGSNNTIEAGALHAAISGGSSNRVSRSYGAISGGFNGIVSGFTASISGGYKNEASGTYSSVSGGRQLVASGNYDWCGGGSTSFPNCH